MATAGHKFDRKRSKRFDLEFFRKRFSFMASKIKPDPRGRGDTVVVCSPCNGQTQV